MEGFEKPGCQELDRSVLLIAQAAPEHQAWVASMLPVSPVGAGGRLFLHRNPHASNRAWPVVHTPQTSVMEKRENMWSACHVTDSQRTVMLQCLF